MCSEKSALGVKKTIIIIWIILWFLLINIFSINSYYNNLEWNKLYKNKDFSWALEFFEKEKNYIWLYNLWNINYRLWEQSLPLQGEDLEGAIKYWEKSVDFYKNSLKLKYNKNTEYNYNFVLYKLKKLKKKQEEEKKREEQKNNKDKKSDKKDKTAGQQGSSAPWRSEWEKKQNWKKWKEIKGWTQGSPLQDKLTDFQKKQIKAYEEKLKQDQKKNAWNFWKVYQENNRNDIFDNFNSFFENDPFFDNSALNNKDEKKDW